MDIFAPEQPGIYPNGTIIAERFEIESFLAAGGMAQVYVARQINVDRNVALKVLSPTFSMNPGVVMRFFREAKVIANLSSPNTVHLFDLGETPDKRLFIAMELLDGEELGDRIRRGKLSPQEALPIVKQVAMSLSEAHQKGIIHRDLKPDNIFLTNLNVVKVLDFGIAKLKEGDDSNEERLTKVGTAPGTPEYMSPEQARGKKLDARSDLYSLGAVLYEMLSGHPPFEEDTFLATILMQVQAPPPPLPNDIPLPLRNYIINRLLAKDPNCRPESADMFIHEIDELSAKINPSKEQEIIDDLRSQLAATKLELLRSCEQNIIDEKEADRLYAQYIQNSPPPPQFQPQPATGPQSLSINLNAMGSAALQNQPLQPQPATGPQSLSINLNAMGPAALQNQPLQPQNFPSPTPRPILQTPAPHPNPMHSPQPIRQIPRAPMPGTVPQAPNAIFQTQHAQPQAYPCSQRPMRPPIASQQPIPQQPIPQQPIPQQPQRPQEMTRMPIQPQYLSPPSAHTQNTRTPQSPMPACPTPSPQLDEIVIPTPRHTQMAAAPAALPKQNDALSCPRDSLTGRPAIKKNAYASKPPRLTFMEFAQPLIKTNKNHIKDSLFLAQYIWNASIIGQSAIRELYGDAKDNLTLRRMIDAMLSRKEKYFAEFHWQIDNLAVKLQDNGSFTLDFDAIGE